MEIATRAPATSAKARYIPRGRNQLHTIFERFLDEFCGVYDERYAAKYGMWSLQNAAGVLQISLRPFSCKGFCLCPSCSQKRTLLVAEHLTNEVLLDLPHRQFVFTMPKALRPFYRHDRRLFAEVSRLIYTIISQFYNAAADKPLLTGVVSAFQSFGDLLRWNAHFHLLVVEGGFGEDGTFIPVPLSGRDQMTEVFCRRLIWLLVEKELLAEEFARNLLCRRDSGFSIDNSLCLIDAKGHESLAEYIARPPLSLRKIRHEPFKEKVLFHTSVLWECTENPYSMRYYRRTGGR